MFGINGFEMVILIIVALFVIGPQRLPEYAAMLRDFVRSFRRKAEGAKETVKKDFGADLDGYDWKSLDPRQYDPRRIVREALAEEDRAIREERRRSGTTGTTTSGSSGTGAAATAAGATAAAGGASAMPSVEDLPGLTPLERHRTQVALRQKGGPAPFDPEAT
ncbi:Sec-independent protein translocase family protein [Brevibacterium senegalense]|uniref:twin-arginine translocase TatA/TatE family subunit n=1 Tax=Brevibacterium senegalense TaxID=1033736 RepID=UPI0002D5BFA8|nr:twin-arginine translocase TatA/TatE family subunit [Brevibacterium senegalense]